jgi:hypothetical protein
MVALAYQRISQRFKVEVPVILEDIWTSFNYDGIIFNYSADGVYLESDYALRPGRKLRLKVNGALDIFTAQAYLAEVRWRRSLPENESHYSFGSGLKFC